MKRKWKPEESGEMKITELSWKPSKGQASILKGINCVFERGNFYGIIGPNGSGKTSLLKNIMRFVESTEGDIELDSIDLRKYKRREMAGKVSLVPQNTHMEAAFSVYDIVMMGRMPYQRRFEPDTEKDREIVLEAMRLTDCIHLKEKEVSLLSGGEAQRVAAARAIAQDTQWIILDEPISNLDVKHQAEMMNALLYLKEKKEKTIIAVLHDINIAATYCSKIVMMKDGKIYSSGKTEEVLTKENLSNVYEIAFEILENDETKRKYYVPCL
ncbi:ABC transporter ATP-binding protein [Anaeromicropila populeti]|uniref:Iron complex transport system ATP-binding protein n=1 Tax=Anaeromicropila populeti TaxID=37658 RepID=A0A1I6J140_9FIRM|nr:ABC transporter ATP-binding protein [Anaeromicropila populeti]SFR72581.1 iron complex transport system ATP-binding protein [Anaeromicropila populeti]